MVEPEPLALLLSDDVQTFLTRLLGRVYLSRVCESGLMIEKTWKKATFHYDAFYEQTLYHRYRRSGSGSMGVTSGCGRISHRSPSFG